MSLSQRLHLSLAGLLCRLILHLSEAETRAVANAWPHLTTMVAEPARRGPRSVVLSAHAEAVRLAGGGKYDRTHPQRREAVDLLLKTQGASIDAEGNLVRAASTPELIKRLDFWRDVELTRAVFSGTTKITAPVAVPVKKIVLPDDDRSPLDELPPWDGVGEDILADTEMWGDAVDTDGDDEEGDE